MDVAMKQPQRGLTFEDVWAAIMEGEAKQEKYQEVWKESNKALIEGAKESQRKLDDLTKLVDRVTKNVGGLNRSMGELIETLIAAKLWEKFDEYPYDFHQVFQRLPIYDDTKRLRSDIDILLADGDYVMAVEVKRQLDDKRDVDDHIRRMELIKKFPPLQCKDKIMLGAMAGGVVEPDTQDYAHKAGLFVLELTGESVALAKRPTGFMPQQW
jgi:hypothetical protein